MSYNSILNNSVSHKLTVSMPKQFYFKQFSFAYKNSFISNNSVKH